MTEIGVGEGRQPPVNTFHSYAYGLISPQGFRQWFGDTEELAHLMLVKAVSQVCRDMDLDEDDLDVDEAKQSIGLWKGALIPPSRAGYAGVNGDAYVAVYKEFEKGRLESNAITFDDFVPLAVDMLANNYRLWQAKSRSLRYIIVDEYQDVNLGQQKLIECLARGGADLMVVGDDDQTIYEWRGARSDYILGEFQSTFTNKPHRTYKLSNSFRFGYSIAQSSYNVILHNSNRLDKHLISSNPARDSHVTLITNSERSEEDEPGGYANRRLAEEIIALVKDQGVAPSDIRVLARTYAQLNPFSTELMLKKIPFKVLGRAPFLRAGESQALLDYVRVAAKLDEIPNDAAVRQFLNIANKPSRYLARRDIQRMLTDGRQGGLTLGELLYETIQDSRKFSRGSARANLEDLTSLLDEVHGKLQLEEETLAGPLLKWIDQEVGFQHHYEDYYGRGEASLTRINTLRTFIAYAHQVGLNWKGFIRHVDNADTTLGRPENEWIKMMTIHTAKGLEFDYVIIPDCTEGYLPVIGSNDDPTYDTAHTRRTPKAAEWIENERRLFYVGATRARKGLFIGAPKLMPQIDGKPGAGWNGTLKPSRSSESPGGSPEHGLVTKMKPSRFLEEMEWEPTQAVATEMVRAARGESNELVEVCQRFSAYHHIIIPVKEVYVRALPNSFNLLPRLARVVLSGAARVFGYKQEYDNLFERTPPPSKAKDEPEDNRGIWEHIKTSQGRRRN